MHTHSGLKLTMICIPLVVKMTSREPTGWASHMHVVHKPQPTTTPALALAVCLTYDGSDKRGPTEQLPGNLQPPCYTLSHTHPVFLLCEAAFHKKTEGATPGASPLHTITVSYDQCTSSNTVSTSHAKQRLSVSE